jgi:hypothetical protein
MTLGPGYRRLRYGPRDLSDATFGRADAGHPDQSFVHKRLVGVSVFRQGVGSEVMSGADRRVYKVWRRASVRLPDGEIRHRQLTFITSEGLELYAEPTERPAWSSPVLFEKTAEPRGGRLHVGIDIETEAGLVVITPTGGCASCGSRMGRWYPAWATNVAAWPKVVDHEQQT